MKPSAAAAPPHILLVDDNRDGLLVRRSLLEEVGYVVEIARNAEEGLKFLQASSFDVVVSDYRMPRMNGKEFIQRVRQTTPAAGIILLSGFVEPLGLTEETTGADVVLIKDSNEAVHLLRWIKRLMNRGAQRKPPAAERRHNSATRARSVGRQNLPH
jgi:CheY-like chemotaxis protein